MLATTDAGFHARASQMHRALWETRLRRERDTSGKSSISGVQPGLFDRRALRDHLASEERLRESSEAARQRVAIVERALTTNAVFSRVVLVLVSRIR
jgi:hypothetical protein